MKLMLHMDCNCSKGNLGAFCKHQAAVYHHFNTSMPNLPAITVNCRLLLAKLAFGEHVPNKLFYMPLICESDSDKTNESLNEANLVFMKTTNHHVLKYQQL